MTERQKYCDTSGVTTEKGQQGGGVKPKTNRLRRSIRQTQASSTITESQKNSQEDFKTPTRVKTISRYDIAFNKVNSPLNESELHHDIIWDATTPSPLRTNGQRGQKYYPNVGIVDISDIVNRIAPKHGRPVVPLSSLDQWIGESAIPCTPELQQPKAKRKSPRTNGVADLLELAKQFDFNIRQDEEKIKHRHKQSLDLLSDSEDVLDFDCQPNRSLPCLLNVPPETTQPTVKTNCTTVPEDPLPPDHGMEDDLDSLFDRPTQHMSGNFSGNLLPCSMEGNIAPTVSSEPICNKGLESFRGHALPVSSPPSVTTSQPIIDFDDDWGNDDLLDDSLVSEITQNPDAFAPPKHCSTQSVSNEAEYVNNSSSAYPGGALLGPHRRRSRDVQQVVPEGDNQPIKHRNTLEGNPYFQLKISSKPSKESVSAALASYSHEPKPTSASNKAASMASGYQQSHQTQRHSNGAEAIQQAPVFRHGTTASTKSSTSVATGSYSTKPLGAEDRSFHKQAENDSSKCADSIRASASPCIFPEDDLDFLFASDPTWDDRGDDDLLCQVCDTLESQAETMAEPLITPSPSPHGNRTPSRTATPAPLNGGGRNVNGDRCVVAQTAAPLPNPNSSTCSPSAPKNGGVFTHPLHSSRVPVAVVSGSTRTMYSGLPGNAPVTFIPRPQGPLAREGPNKSIEVRVTDRTTKQHVTGSDVQPPSCPAPVNQTSNPSQFTFKRPSGCIPKSVNYVTSEAFVSTQAVGKCSAEEIELKKQQAMEKRRQRMLTASHLRTLT